MANFNDIKHEIDQNVNTNGVQAITGAILNETLKDMIDEVDEKKQDTLVAGQNITIQGNVISATGGGSGEEYYAGRGIDIDSSNYISVNPSEIVGYGLEVGEEGYIRPDWNVVASQNDLAGKQDTLAAGANIQISGPGPTVISATDTTYSAGQGLSLNGTTFSVKAGSGLGFDANGYLINTGGGGGGTTYTAGDGIEIDQNDAINAKLGNGLQLDQNNNIEVDTTVVATQNDLSGKQDTLTAGSNISISGSTISATDTTYSAGNGLSLNGTTFSIDGTVVATQNDLSGKQDSLTASNGISIDASNNISVKAGTGLAFDSNGNLYATGGGGGTTYTAGNGIDISAQDVISVDASDLDGNGLTVDQNGALAVDTTTIQEKLTAGTGITITGNTISATGGGGSGLWSSGTGTNSLLAPESVSSGATASGTGALNAGYYDSNHSGNPSAATGDYSAVFGTGNSALGDNSFATGEWNKAGAKRSAVIGGSNGTTNAIGSVIVGGDNSQITSNGEDSVVIGGGYINASGSVAIRGRAESASSLALGVNAETHASSSIAIGASYPKATTYGQGSVAIGTDSTTDGTNSVALGLGSRAKNAGEVGLGQFNKSYQSNTSSVATSFTVGNGSTSGGTNTYSNALEIKANDDIYVVGVGNFDGTNSGASGVQTLQDVINNGGGGGTSFTAGNALELDANDNLNVLYGSGLTLNGNNELEVDPSSISGFLPLDGGQLQADPLVPATDTVLDILGPQGVSDITLDSGDNGDPNDPQGTATITMTDSNGYIQIKPTGVSDGTYTAMWPTLSADDTIATLSDIPSASSLAGDGLQDDGNGALEVKLGSGLQFDANGAIETTGGGGGSYVAGNGIDITSGTISVDETYLDSVYLPIIGGSLENTSNHTDLRVDAPNAESDNFVDILSPGTGVPSVELGTDTNTQGEVESLKFKGDADIDIKYVGDNTTYTLSFPTLTQNETIATLSDIQGGGSYVAGSGIDITSGTISVDTTYLDGLYLPLTGGSLKDTAVGATETLLDVQAPDSTGALSFSADTLAAMIQMSADRDDANVADGTTYGINFDNSGDVDILVKTVNPLDPTDISTTTYTQTFQQKSGTIALLSDISGGGTTYTAGAGINIDANNEISSTTLKNGTGNGSIMTLGGNSASGQNSIALGYYTQATASNSVALGNFAVASANYAVAIGDTAKARAAGSISIGKAAGPISLTTGTNSINLGYYAEAKNTSEIAIGPANISINTGTDAEKTQFTVGNGTDLNSRSNLIEAKKNNDIYVVGVGGFDGTNAGSTGVHTLQYAIANAGGGGGSSLWTSGTGTDSLVAPGTVSAGLTGDAAGTGAVSCGYDSNANGDYSFACGGASTAGGDYSFAANNGTASGDYSAAFGTSGASGDRSFAAGDGSIAGAAYSVALAGGLANYDDSDPQNIINAEGSVAIGNGAVANAYQAIVIGSSANTSDIAIDGIAIGVAAYANAQEAVAIGSSSTAEGLGTVALSSGTASGEHSTAMSSGSAVGSYSVAGGLGALTGAYSSVALGFQTMTYDQGDPTDPSEANAGETALGRYNYTEQDFIFTVGCGQEIYHDPDDPDFEPNPEDPDNPDGWTEIVRQNAITITSDGNIYIKGAGGYLGQGITGADSLQTLLYNLNPQ